MPEIVQITIDFFKNPNVWKYAIMAFIPVFAYSWFFYKKTPRPQPKKIFLATFVIGCFSVAPLLLYQYIYLHYFPKIETTLLIENLILRPYISGLISYLFHIGFIGLLIFIIVFLITITTTFFAGKTFKNVFRSILEENFNFQFIALFVGVFVLIEIFLNNFFAFTVMQSMLGIIVIRAMMEEYSKHLIIRFTDDDQLFNIDDAIVLSLFVGLSFAFIENILYFSHYPNDLFTLFLGRSLLTVLAHVVFSGIFGYYYGIAHFASPLYFEQHTVSGKKSVLLWFFSKIFRLKQSNILHEIMILKGLFLATFIHTIFNLLLELGYVSLAMLVILGTALLLLKLLAQKENYRQLGLIGTEIMPVQDYKNLTWKIDSLHWAKKIKEEREEREKEN